MPKAPIGTYPEYFQRYIDQVEETDLSAALENQLPQVKEFLSTISEEKSLYAYAEGKWTIREVLQHIIDAERIFCYRALCIARGETASLPGFEEDDYAAKSGANGRSWKSLSEEMLVVRESTIMLFNSFPPGALEASGISNQKSINTLALGFIIAGHINHHIKVLRERYLG